MGILIYATSDDLAAWTGAAAPSNAAALLRSASLLVREASATALYDVDGDGYPTDTDVAQVMQDATCAHAAALDAAGVDPAAAGTDAGVASTSLGGASITYAGASDAAVSRLSLTYRLAPEAARILHNEQLLAAPPQSYAG